MGLSESLYAEAAEVWRLPGKLVELAEKAEELTRARRAYWRDRADRNFLRVLEAFQEAGVGEGHLAGTTGYGYDDPGREVLDTVFARVFQAEAALVRLQIVSGTHAVSLALRAAAEPGDVLVSATGRPYDSLLPQIRRLQRNGVRYVEVDLDPDGRLDPEAVVQAVGEAALTARRAWMAAFRSGVRPGTSTIGGGRVCLFVQRSCGYHPVPSRSVGTIEKVLAEARSEAAAAGTELVSIVDNCYGEFVEEREPTAAGADLVAGSLTKNPGGGLAPTGGYVAGKSELVGRAAELLTAPGIGDKGGPTLGLTRLFLQGLFCAPSVVGTCLAGATFAAAFLESLGLEVSPGWDDERTDIVQCVRLGSREAVLAFARGVQAASPLDAQARPVGASLPGYEDEVVMAAGTFVQGASIELSLDAPLRPPFAAYLQGGLNEAHLKLAVVRAAAELLRAGHGPQAEGGVVSPSRAE
jgi:cystathionine beta-lyase family protein involved in aluminum resistance